MVSKLLNYQSWKMGFEELERGFEGPPLYDTYPDEEDDIEPEAATSETEESEKDNDGIAGEYYGGDDEPKWDIDVEEPPPKVSPEEELDGGATMEEVDSDCGLRERTLSLVTKLCDREGVMEVAGGNVRAEEGWREGSGRESESPEPPEPPDGGVFKAVMGEILVSRETTLSNGEEVVEMTRSSDGTVERFCDDDDWGRSPEERDGGTTVTEGLACVERRQFHSLVTGWGDECGRERKVRA